MSGVLQWRQCVMPLRLALVRAWSLAFFHCAVPVLLVAMSHRDWFVCDAELAVVVLLESVRAMLAKV